MSNITEETKLPLMAIYDQYQREIVGSRCEDIFSEEQGALQAEEGEDKT